MHDQITYNMIQEIAQHTSDVRHLPGKENAMVDALSRPANVGPAIVTPAIVPSQTPMDALNDVTLTFETVDHRALATAQETCPDVEAHREGQQPAKIQMKDVEFVPGTHLFCEMLTGKARPLVPQPFRQTVFNAFHKWHILGRKGQ